MANYVLTERIGQDWKPARPLPSLATGNGEQQQPPQNLRALQSYELNTQSAQDRAQKWLYPNSYRAVYS